MGNRCDLMYFGSNTKMSKTDAETVEFINGLRTATKPLWGKPIRMFVVPSFTALGKLGALLEGTPIELGAQNLCCEERGAYTGEVSVLSLKENGVSIAEIGHSERRHIFGETDDLIAKKVSTALKAGLTPLLCIGESAHSKAVSTSDEMLSIQLKEGLAYISSEDAAKIWVAYEPVWAIGEKGTCAEPEYVEKRHTAIKRTLCEMFGEDIGGDIPVVYGGSVNRENAAELIGCKNVNGLFVGRSAWSAEGFASIAGETLAIYGKNLSQ